jgi:hypothetical protein
MVSAKTKHPKVLQMVLSAGASSGRVRERHEPAAAFHLSSERSAPERARGQPKLDEASARRAGGRCRRPGGRDLNCLGDVVDGHAAMAAFSLSA